MILNNPVWGILHTISPSRINSYIRCGVKFQLEYIHKMRAPGSLNMHRGSGLHKAIEHDNKHFMTNDARLGYDALKSIAMTEFEDIIRRDGIFIPARDIDKKMELISKARNELLESVRLYANMEKNWIPDTVEEYLTEDIGYPLPARIRIDLIDNNHTIYDWKTSAKNTQIIPGLQDWLYSKYYETVYGVRPRFKYVKFILSKKNSHIEIDELEPIRNYDRLENYIKSYFWGIENNVFLPASDTDFLCSESCCPFYLTCEFKRN